MGDLEKLTNDLRLMATTTGMKANQAVRKAALDAQAYMQRPSPDGAPRDTGTLANSISVKQEGALQASAVTNVFYAPFVARGTRFMAPNPFDLRAKDAVEPGFVKAMEHLAGDL